MCSNLTVAKLDTARALKNREERMVTPAMGAAMIGPMYSLWENRAQHGGGGFHLRLSILKGSRYRLLFGGNYCRQAERQRSKA